MDTVKVQQVKSVISCNASQRATLRSLGLRRISDTATHKATPQIMGQIHKITHLIKFEMVKAPPKKRRTKKE